MMSVSGIHQLAALYQTSPVSGVSARRQAQPAGSAIPPQTDTAEISGSGKALARLGKNDLMTALFPGIDTSDGISLDELSGLLREKTSALSGEFETLFQKEGIDTSQEAVLQSDMNGKVIVAGNHPDKARIEELFANDPGLTNRFHEVDALASVIRAGREASQFQKEYAVDPEAAVAKYSYLFSGSYSPAFNLGLSDSGLSIFFSGMYFRGRQPLDY
jgi:hypothetical protein